MMDILQNLDTPPASKRKVYVQSDYVELTCLIHPDRVLSKSELYAKIAEDADINDQNDYEEISDDIATSHDTQYQRIDEWFQYLGYREAVLGRAYPFELSNDESVLKVKDSFCEHNKLYIYLLMASSLGYFSDTAERQITESFEVLSAFTLSQYLGNRAIVRIFGKGTRSDYRGNKLNKLTRLADDIRERVKPSEGEFDPNDTGDEGLDVVAWFPTIDNSPGRLLVFGQCTCGDDWESKQHSSSYDKWRGLISLSVAPINTLFMPYFFRDSVGDWYRHRQIHNSLMIDRLRFMNLLSPVESPLQMLTDSVHTLINDTVAFVDEF